MFEGVKKAIGIGDDEDEEDMLAEELGFSDEDDGMDEVDIEDVTEDVEDESPFDFPYETAYKAADDMIETRGFAGMREFVGKAMAHRVNKSSEFRDRLEAGAQTANLVRESVTNLKSVSVGGDNLTDYGEAADQLAEANAFVNEYEEFVDEEGQIARSAIAVANKGVDALKEYSESQKGTAVKTNIRREDGEL